MQHIALLTVETILFDRKLHDMVRAIVGQAYTLGLGVDVGRVSVATTSLFELKDVRRFIKTM